VVHNYDNLVPDIKTLMQMIIEKLITERKRILRYIIAGSLGGAVYGCIEYFARLNTDKPEIFIPLLIRTMSVGILVFGLAAIFEIWSQSRFAQKQFIYLLLGRSIAYTFIITLSLLLVNTVWYIVKPGASLKEELEQYLEGGMYFINLSTIFLLVVIAVGLAQINDLHKKGELLNYVLGRYHRPREVDRIFCFIDLKNSTSIAEKLGHLKFAMFLRDYYSDISEALRKTAAQIYQYVGDEIVLSWSFSEGLKDNNLIHCVFLMKKILNGSRQKYLNRYSVYPEFRAGLHGGKVIVTWVGELKKEIVYIGDTVNTASRIQEDCKRLEKDFLVSEDILKHIPSLGATRATFLEETIPRGKAKSIKLYSLVEA
jgi:adenylate cyclase